MFYYSVNNSKERIKFYRAGEIGSYNGSYCAENAAEDYYLSTGGFAESELTVTLYKTKKGRAVGVYLVRVDYTPVFFAGLVVKK